MTATAQDAVTAAEKMEANAQCAITAYDCAGKLLTLTWHCVEDAEVILAEAAAADKANAREHLRKAKAAHRAADNAHTAALQVMAPFRWELERIDQEAVEAADAAALEAWENQPDPIARDCAA